MPLKTTLATLVAAALLGAGTLPWWLSQPERLSRIVARAVPELEADVRFESVKLGWAGPLVLEGVSLVPRDGSRSPISIGRIEGSHGLLAMLLSAGDLGRLTVDGLAVDLAFDENHVSNLEGLVRRKPADAADPTPKPTRAAVRMRLEIEDAVVRITAPWTTEPWVSEPIDLRVALAPVAEGWSEWTVEPVQLLTDARMDPPVAWGVLAYVAPVLADAARTSGRFSLALDGARLPVGDPASGSLSGTLAMHEVVVGPGPMVTNLFQSLPGNLPPPPSIRVADESHVKFALDQRRVRHEGLEFGVPLPGPGRRLDVRSSGTVGLDDQSLDVKLVLPIPADLRQDRPLLAALAGKTISMGVEGRLGEPKIVFDGSIRQVAGDVARELIDRVRGGVPPAPAQVPPSAGPGVPPPAPQGAPPGAPPGAGNGEAVADLVGDVIDEIARRRAARQAAEAAGELPPRRGRLRERVFRPVQPPLPQ
jgi:hypothetical protein